MMDAFYWMHETLKGGASWFCLFRMSLQTPTEVTTPNIPDTTFNLYENDVRDPSDETGRKRIRPGCLVDYWIPLCFMCWGFVDRCRLPQPLMMKFNSNDFEMQLLFCLTTMTWVKGHSAPHAARRAGGQAAASWGLTSKCSGGDCSSQGRAGRLVTGRLQVRSPAPLKLSVEVYGRLNWHLSTKFDYPELTYQQLLSD